MTDPVPPPEQPTTDHDAAIAVAWATLGNDVRNPNIGFPASVEELFRVGRYNVETAYTAKLNAALAEARAAVLSRILDAIPESFEPFWKEEPPTISGAQDGWHTMEFDRAAFAAAILGAVATDSPEAQNDG